MNITTGTHPQSHSPTQDATGEITVKAFYQAALNEKDFNAASKYLGSQYIQHNPQTEDGVEGFAKFVTFLKTNYPHSQFEFKQVFSDGNYVILHIHAKLNPEDRGMAVVDIFRLQDGKIIEHWDVVQPIPDEALHNNGMF